MMSNRKRRIEDISDGQSSCPSKKQKRDEIKFELKPLHRDNAKAIYAQILGDPILGVQRIAKCIAEYAACVQIQCTDCSDTFIFEENEEKWKKNNYAICVFGNNNSDEPIYYIVDTETTLDRMKVICTTCATQYFCNGCDYQGVGAGDECAICCKLCCKRCNKFAQYRCETSDGKVFDIGIHTPVTICFDCAESPNVKTVNNTLYILVDEHEYNTLYY
eukprot:452658_1